LAAVFQLELFSPSSYDPHTSLCRIPTVKKKKKRKEKKAFEREALDNPS
jgi:hypothetical protein